ncbi:MAG: 4Fe-4S dicluster domain-containing protein [Anaerolineales bacterium]|jgi:Fe-S-cluster-containing dehydrogenase component
MSKESKVERRDFLKLLAMGAGATALVEAGTKIQKSTVKASGPEGGEHSWVMVIDQEKCVGCGDCTLACQASNDIHPDINWTRVFRADRVGEETVYLPVPCQHCENAPCVSACMVGASYYRDDGIVMMDYDLCIGCRYCITACPYQARSFNWDKFEGDNPAVPEWGEPDIERRPRGVVEKCSFCYQKIDRGLTLGLTPGKDPEATPACVVACPTGARVFGDRNDPESEVNKLIEENHVYRLKEDLGTKPRVFYIPASNNSEATS